ncbi:MAG: tryptophan--tRNA ligase, partial [Anaerolineales bacterium]|jgi:tryptophanyl-tRNA synthetase
VFIYHDTFNPDVDEVNDLKERYRKGKVGDVEVKQKLAKAINNFLEPMRQRRAAYETDPSKVDEIIVEGTRRARKIAKETIEMVRDAMGLYRPMKD